MGNASAGQKGPRNSAVTGRIGYPSDHRDAESFSKFGGVGHRQTCGYCATRGDPITKVPHVSAQEHVLKYQLACLRLEAECMQLVGDVASAPLRSHFLGMARRWRAAADSGPGVEASLAGTTNGLFRALQSDH